MILRNFAQNFFFIYEIFFYTFVFINSKKKRKKMASKSIKKEGVTIKILGKSLELVLPRNFNGTDYKNWLEINRKFLKELRNKIK